MAKKPLKRKDGLFEVKMSIGTDIYGAPIRKSFYSPISKADAKKQGEAYKIEWEIAQRTAITFVTKEVTFETWAIKWLEIYKRPNVTDNAFRFSYENTVKNHLLEHLGKYKLTDIKPIHIQQLYTKKSEYSVSILKKIQMCLNDIFNTAIDNDLCAKNPAKKVSFTSKKIKKPKRVFTDIEIKKAKALSITYDMPEITVLLETGLRRGELLGLQWNDIDFKHHILSVNRSVADKYGGGTSLNPPKWNSYRKIPLSPETMSLLQNINKVSDFVFPLNETGKIQSPATWGRKLDRVMKKMHEADDTIPMLTAHEMRHTYGTALRRRCVDIYTIQKVMGHRDISMTSELYVHNEDNELKKALGFE